MSHNEREASEVVADELAEIDNRLNQIFADLPVKYDLPADRAQIAAAQVAAAMDQIRAARRTIRH